MDIALDNGFQILETLEIIFSKRNKEQGTRNKEQGREVFANRVFYKGFGMPGYYFIEDPAIPRSVGWLAHSFKIRAHNKIIPAAAFCVGPAVYEKVV